MQLNHAFINKYWGEFIHSVCCTPSTFEEDAPDTDIYHKTFCRHNLVQNLKSLAKRASLLQM